MKFRQGNVFTPVCDSVHRGVTVQGVFCPGAVDYLGGHQGHVPPGSKFFHFHAVFGTPHRKIMDLPLWGSLPRGSLSRGVSVQEGLCLGVSVWGGVSV